MTAVIVPEWQKPVIRVPLKAIPAEVKQDIHGYKAEREKKLRYRDATLDLGTAWGFEFDKPAVDGDKHAFTVEIQPNDRSRLHKLSDAIQRDDVIWLLSDYDDVKAAGGPLSKDMQTFVINSDWSKLLDGEVLQGEFQLPYERCAFEFRVCGRTVIALCKHEKDAPVSFMAFYETKTGDWCNIGDIGVETWEAMIRTVCVMLEAEVAVQQVKRADYKLNAKREKKGELPLYDFHTLTLARRHRTTGAPGMQTGGRKRLHFCRGHWRHYETHKTWIKWCLKGDESLGFVDKDYRM